jgi:Na+-driven multidrug efflux pump
MKISFTAMTIWGLFVTLLMLFFGRFFMSVFLHESEAINLGAAYMIFLAVCQVTGSIENMPSSFLRGIGKTLPPSAVSILCNTIRVPIAYFLSITPLGLYGLWVGFIFGAILRGVVLVIVYLANVRKAYLVFEE